MPVKFVIDAGCDLDHSQASALGVSLVPMTIRFGDKEYRSGYDLTTSEFYQKLEGAQELPTTSQPTPYDFQQVFQEIVEQGDQVVVLCVSSLLSGTYQSAMIAAAEFPNQVCVIDTKAVSLGQRILLEYGLSLSKYGATAVDIATELEKKKQKIRIYGAVESLEYLIKGGRLSKAAGAVGSVLGIRPVLHLADGQLAVAGKARGLKAVIALTHELIEKDGIDMSMPFAVGFTGNSDAVLEPFLSAPNCAWKDKTVPTYQIGSTVGTHTGPGLFMAAFFLKT